MGRVEILGAVERRRRWTAEEKVAILDDAFRAGGSVAAASDRNGVSRALIYYWRRLAREGGIVGVSIGTSMRPGIGLRAARHIAHPADQHRPSETPEKTGISSVP